LKNDQNEFEKYAFVLYSSLAGSLCVCVPFLSLNLSLSSFSSLFSLHGG